MLKAKYRKRIRLDKTSSERKARTNPLTFSLYIGFYAGLIWGALKLFEFALRFTNIVPGFLIEPFFQHAYLVTYSGLVLGYASFILFSVVAAVLYGMFMRRIPGPLPGLAYGVVWWALLYLLVGPLTDMMPAVTQIDLNSFASDLSLFLLWGLFIGFSISYEFTEERERDSNLSRMF